MNQTKPNLLRTDGRGSSSNDNRLKLLAQMLEFRGQYNSWDFSKIELLHDHKGLLNVTWSEVPKLEDVWEVNEIWTNFFLEEKPTHTFKNAIYDRDFNY
jgi:hypothetical protein